MSAMQVSPGMIRGTLSAPASKSYTHRALIAGHLTGHRYTVANPLVSDDTLATARGLAALGTRVRLGRGRWQLEPSPVRRSARRPGTVRCGESGTTLRLLSAAAALRTGPTRFTGTGRLVVRPMEDLVETLREHGATVTHPRGRALPMEVRGPLSPGAYSVAGSVSSQFVSALLLSLPTLEGASTLHVTGRRVSEPYVQATLEVLRRHHVRVRGTGARYLVPAPQSFVGRSSTVPGDASSAAYLWAGAALTGGSVSVRLGAPGWPQADLAVLDVLRAAGARVRSSSTSIRVDGPIGRPFDVDLTAAPDLYPLVGVLAASVSGRSRIRGAAHVEFKESNRRTATMRLIRAIGGRPRIQRGSLVVDGAPHPRALRVRGITDHRVVMSAAVGALAGPRPSVISEPGAVAKSYPGFWTDLGRLGAQVARVP